MLKSKMKQSIQLNWYYHVRKSPTSEPKELLSRFELAGCNNLLNKHFAIWKKMSTINYFNS